MMRKYCEAVGIDFQPSMINWKPMTPEMMEFMGFTEWQPWLETALDTNGFLKKDPSPLPNIKDLPQDVQDAIALNMPFYEELHAKRIQP